MRLSNGGEGRLRVNYARDFTMVLDSHAYFMDFSIRE